MSNRKNPDTSIAAYRKLDPLRLAKTYLQIVESLKVIGEGNFEAIAEQAGVKPEKVWKRLSELVRSGIIYRTDNTVMTKNKCNAHTYKICDGEKPDSKIEKAISGKSIADYSRYFVQKKLFE